MEEYKTPTKAVFAEIKRACIKQWKKHFYNENGYIDEKLARIESYKNQGANIVFIFNMFGGWHRGLIMAGLSEKAKEYIKYYNEENKRQELERSQTGGICTIVGGTGGAYWDSTPMPEVWQDQNINPCAEIPMYEEGSDSLPRQQDQTILGEGSGEDEFYRG
jgi:hypothetical protein